MTARRRYTGLLAKPIDPKRYLTEFEARMDALLDHYGIARDEPGARSLLACALAEAHVPGFRVKAAGRRPGRKRGWPIERALALNRDVKAIVDGPRRLTVAAACRKLVATPPWQGYSRATLEKRYSLFLGYLDQVHAWFQQEFDRPPAPSPFGPRNRTWRNRPRAAKVRERERPEVFPK